LPYPSTNEEQTMVNKPRQIGTFAETGTLKAILPYFPAAKRITQHGSDDQGDIDSGDHADFVFEVKGGKQCRQVGDAKLQGWMDETDRERDELGKKWGVLVVQRAGFGQPRAARWWAYVHLGDLAWWSGGEYRVTDPRFVRLELGHLLELLADHGFTADKPWPETAEELSATA
jgi:hypothetical protein